MAALGALVIYALILGDVEARTYELGMLRALGIGEGALGALLALQTASFAVPGVLVGLGGAAVLYCGVSAAFGWFAAVDVGYTMPASAWIFGVVSRGRSTVDIVYEQVVCLPLCSSSVQSCLLCPR